MDEEQIIKKAMLGDKSCTQALIHSYYDIIYCYCYRLSGNKTVGADLCQDVFMKMTLKLPSYKNQGKFKSWLFKIAINTCRDEMRKRHYEDKLDDKLTEQNTNIVTQTENSMLIKKALDLLPIIQREVIILRFYHDFSLEDIARFQHIPVATVKTRLHRGLKKMKTILGEDVLLER